ncbi:hypothetical protein EG68_07293 [Paragonimus skrjabini miyazakii]|uniref:Uncharacterized protein n=1 Tax=Paragonimus skrjabini miyazakii TaxID=59628 RepID=A0A8S9YRQ8_9TREM|nr:hypothetical protein EG68_07293 [Paragonimus skrjabini miyazakii]
MFQTEVVLDVASFDFLVNTSYRGVIVLQIVHTATVVESNAYPSFGFFFWRWCVSYFHFANFRKHFHVAWRSADLLAARSTVLSVVLFAGLCTLKSPAIPIALLVQTW